MTITSFSSRQFNQDSTRAKKASKNGPVFITDRGKPAHVLLSIDDYQRLTKNKTSIVELLAMPDDDVLELELPARSELAHGADLS